MQVRTGTTDVIVALFRITVTCVEFVIAYVYNIQADTVYARDTIRPLVQHACRHPSTTRTRTPNAYAYVMKLKTVPPPPT